MINQIIEILSDDMQSLTSALFKTQILASRLDNNELASWAISELKGYRQEKLPEYRYAKASPKCSLVKGVCYSQNQPMPILIFPEKYHNILVRLPLDQGIKTLEDIASGKHGDYVVKEYGEDFGAYLTKKAFENGHRIQVSDVRIMVHIGEVTHTLGEVRTRLLQFMLTLEKEYPNLEEDIKSKAFDKQTINQTITYIMSQVNINTNGDGNITNTGDNSTIHANVHINKGDMKALSESLEKMNVPKEDITEILQIVKDDNPDYDKKTLGIKSRTWISKMISKTLDGTWQLATGTAAGLLTEVLKHYFGM